MDEVESKGVTVRSSTSEEFSPLAKARHVGVDTRSREAFELLKLGEAICNLQSDQRRMRLNAEDMRFERDRYKASAVAFQEKLDAALNENIRLRDLREVLSTLSLQGAAQVENERASLHTALHKSAVDLEELRLEYERVLIETHGIKIQAEQDRADAEAERTRLASALHQNAEEIAQLRHENQQFLVELQESRVQGEHMRQEVLAELQDSKVRAEHMRQASITLMQGLIIESQSISDQDKDVFN